MCLTRTIDYYNIFFFNKKLKNTNSNLSLNSYDASSIILEFTNFKF